MAISALPQNTIHLLGSAQALTTPTSLVKELVDNSIDAQATSIDILISPNTIDKIEVRDNGHGIAEDDLDALGRRGHTSKLRTFEDLKAIGGISLGFRGEALASAVQLGEVSVITRTDGQPVASSIKIKTGGGIDSQSRVSHPVGTTVSVAKFMFKLPVRKHRFEVEATKTLAKVKDLLRGYALARPHIRFGLKVTKGGKGSWSHAPRPNDGWKEAVSQILDRNLATQCIEKTLTFFECHGSTNEDNSVPVSEDHEESANSMNKFVVEAFLPKPDADPSKIGFGQWISIDSRPVAHDKGTMRRIVTLFKHYVKGIVTEGQENIKTPFLRLNLKCPELSYDPNVEPAKDDVLFANEPLVLELIEGFFKDLYGDPPSKSALPRSDAIPNDFNLLLARKPSKTAITSPRVSTPCEGDSVPLLGEQDSEANSAAAVTSQDQGDMLDLETEGQPLTCTKRKWVFDISEDYSGDVEGALAPKKRLGGWGPSPKSIIDSTKSNNGLNPWLIAKLNLPVRDGHEDLNEPTKNSAAPRPVFPTTPERSSSPLTHSSTHTSISRLDKPRRILQNDEIGAVYLPSSQHDFQQARPAGRFQPPIPGFRPQKPVVREDDNELLLGDDSETFRRRTGFISAKEAPAPEDSSQMPAPKSKKVRVPNKPFVSPMRSNDVPFSVDNLRQTTLTGNHTSRSDNVPRDVLHQENEDELAWAMDYETRKEESVRRRREELRAKRSEPEVLVVEDAPRASPHQNRYNAAIAALGKDDSGKENTSFVREIFQTTLPDGDARAYLMRRQKSMQAQAGRQRSGKLSHAKSKKLPLETVPNQEQLHNVLQKLPTSVPSLSQLTTMVAKSDIYVSRGIQAAGLAMSALETTLVATRIEEVVEEWMTKTNPEEEIEVLFNFQNLINDKFR